MLAFAGNFVGNTMVDLKVACVDFLASEGVPGLVEFDQIVLENLGKGATALDSSMTDLTWIAEPIHSHLLSRVGVRDSDCVEWDAKLAHVAGGTRWVVVAVKVA